MITYDMYTDGALADLALPNDLERELRDALDGEHHIAIRTDIEDRITAKLSEHGVDTDTGEWLGTWSAERIVRDVLAANR